MRTTPYLCANGSVEKLGMVRLLASANAPILPVAAPTSNIGRSIPLRRWLTVMQKSVVESDTCSASSNRLLGGVGRGTGDGGPYPIRPLISKVSKPACALSMKCGAKATHC